MSIRIRRRRLSALCLAAGMLLCACNDNVQESSTVTESAAPEPENTEVLALAFTADGVRHAEDRFLPEDAVLTLTAPEGAVIRYTLDGSEPAADSEIYTAPIAMPAESSDFPGCAVLRAKAFYTDGSCSGTATQTFFAAKDMSSCFHNLIVSVAGDPKELTEEPDGILCGENAKESGRQSERAVSVEFIAKDGGLVLEQDAGVRVYGKASREFAIKSLKLFARKSYDPEHGKFAYDGFSTAGKDGDIIGKYDKLVLRSAGNDFQFAFIRDELFQTLAADAGYTDCEAVQPVTVYLNGNYYGQLWLHENLCDDLLKAKYGGKDGKYQILEGREREKTVSETDAEDAALAEAFNARYAELAALDLTDEANYAEVCAWLDVPQYLSYFAYNYCINNFDWPQGNEKCYRYQAAEGEAYGADRLDGRWRFWFHDMDYSAGLYEQEVTQADYNALADIFDPESRRWAPLFEALMQRSDCRTAFREKVQSLTNSTLTAEHIQSTLDAMNTARYFEMKRYYAYLEELKKSDDSVWTWYQQFQTQTAMISSFAVKRAEYTLRYLDEMLPPLEAE